MALPVSGDWIIIAIRSNDIVTGIVIYRVHMSDQMVEFNKNKFLSLCSCISFHSNEPFVMFVEKAGRENTL